MSFPERGHKNMRTHRFSEVGSYYFLTLATHNRESFLDLSLVFRTINECLSYLTDQKILQPICLVVMSDHVHLVFQLESLDLARAMHRFKTFTARSINWHQGKRGQVWSAQYYEHLIRRDESLQRIVEYCRDNPVRRGLVEMASEWPYWWCCYPGN
jgi:putative transposase